MYLKWGEEAHIGTIL